MKVECIINGQIRMLIYPENDMESEILKHMMKQDNTLTEIRSSVQLLGRSVSHAVMIERRSVDIKDDSTKEEEM